MSVYGAYAESVRPIFEEHRKILEEDSAIAREVYEESGVRSVAHGRELPSGFSQRQRSRGSGILFTVPRPNGKTAPVFRPDKPDPENPGLRYEATCKKLGGPGNILFVLPSQRHLIGDKRVPVIFVEGVKKALSIITAARADGVEVLVVGILGVWNWLSKGKPIADMLGIPVGGRKVFICFDSDVFINPDVGDAARRLAGHLIGRGAEVGIAYLSDQADGSKTGADDYLASGHTYAQLMALMRRYDPANFRRIRLSRDEALRTAIAAGRHAWWDYDWSKTVGTGEKPNSMRGHTARDVAKVLLDKGELRGEAKEGMVEVEVSTRMVATDAATSRQSTMKALRNLEAEGLIEILEAGAADKPRRYRLLMTRATLDHDGGKGHESFAVVLGGQDLRAPRLWWSSPGRKARRGMDKETRRVRDNVQPAVEGVRRLGKVRGAVVDALKNLGGSGTLKELCEVLHRSRPRDLRRRVLPMLEDSGIVLVEGETVLLADDWVARIREARVIGGELECEKIQRQKHRREQEAFHQRSENRSDYHHANVGADGYVKDLQLVGETEDAPVPPDPPLVSPLAMAIRAYLDRNPHDADQLPGWIGSTLWALNLFEGKPTPADVQVAIGELGSETYLRSCLERARGEAA